MIVDICLGLLVGAAGSWLYFEALWWTVSRVPNARRPYMLLGGSFLVRGVLLLALVGALAWWSWPALVAAPVGFWAMRLRVVGRHATEPT